MGDDSLYIPCTRIVDCYSDVEFYLPSISSAAALKNQQTSFRLCRSNLQVIKGTDEIILELERPYLSNANELWSSSPSNICRNLKNGTHGIFYWHIAIDITSSSSSPLFLAIRRSVEAGDTREDIPLHIHFSVNSIKLIKWTGVTFIEREGFNRVCQNN